MRVAALVLAAIIASAVTGEAADLLFFNSDPGDYIGQGFPQRFTDADAAFSATQNYDGGVSLTIDSGQLGGWNLDFAAPEGAPLAPGTYEGAMRFPFQAPPLPGLSVDGESRGCNTLSGRFVVLDVAYGAGSDVLRFSADFEQHCEEGQPALFGSIRFHAGDATCNGANDGTPCDDVDACSPSSACQQGTCTAVGTTACAAGDVCQVAACDPGSGVCVSRGVPDVTYVACDDGNACTVEDHCAGGVCTGGAPAPGCCATNADCDDHDPCTVDSCGADGSCTHTAAPCWRITGRAVGTATVPSTGRSVQRAERLDGLLLLNDDGTYRIPAGSCPGTGESLPDEVGSTRPGRRGRLVLAASNLAEQADALSQCIGHRVRLKNEQTWVRILADGDHLRGMSTVHANAHASGIAISLVITERFRGVRIDPVP